MNKTIAVIFKRVLATLAVLLSAVALLSLSARWFIYNIEQYRETIVSQISKTLKLDVSVAEINGRVDFINPIIYAEQVQLSNAEASVEPMAVDKMEVVIDLLSSVLHAEPRIQSIRMAGIELAIVTDLENRLLQLPQLDKAWNMPVRDFNLKQLLTEAVAMDYFDLGFHDVLIHWRDINIEGEQTFNIKHFVLNPQFHSTRLALVADLPQTLGQTLTLISSFDHDVVNPSGDFYINTEDLNLENVSRLSGAQAAHEGYLQAELWGRASYRLGLEDLSGRVSLKDYLNPTLNSADAISFDGELNWQAQADDRVLGLADLSLQHGAAIIENADLAIVQRQDEDNYSSNLRLSADYIAPSIYNQLLSYAQTDFSIEQHRTETTQNERAVDLILQTKHAADWFVSPYRWPPIQALESLPPADLPHLSGGRLELMLQNIGISRGQWTAPQNLERIELKGSYKSDSEGDEWYLEHLHIKASDSTLSGATAYKSAGSEDKHLRALLELHNLEATEIIQWLPQQQLNAKLENWLSNAIGGGSVQYAELAIDGNPDFPFAKNAGLWRLHAKAEDLDLLYRAKDPRLKASDLNVLLENQTLKIHSDDLQIMGFQSNDTTVLLDDITVPYIKISSQGRGPLADILSYVTSTGLVDADSVLVSNIQADGDVDMNLKVHTRLSPKVDRETYVGGYIDLNGANLKLKTLDLDLKQLEGRLHFDRSGGRSDNIKALLNGTYAVTATAEADEGSTLLKMETRMPLPTDYLAGLSLPPNTFNTAADTWQAELLIPPLRAASQGAVRLKLNSKLQALAVNMPAPLHKRIGETIDTTLIANITNTASDYQFDYGDRMRVVLRIAKDGTTDGLLHFSPRIAYPHEADTDNQFIVRGVIPYLAVDEWVDWQQEHSRTAAQTTLYTQDVDVLIEKLVWNTSTAHQVLITIKRQQDKSLVSFDSEEIKGQASIPTEASGRVYIDLEHLILSDDSLSRDSQMLDPTSLPPIAIKIDQFKLGNFDMADLRAALNPTDDGVRITKMNFNKKDGDKILIQAQLEGDWTRVNEQDYSNFKFLASSDDYGALLHDWNFYSGLKGGQGQVSGQLQWQHNPLGFELDQLQGPVRLRIKDGAIEAIEPGVGRLFGLLNINALARRLRLDFKDVFDKGFEFDELKGTLKFDKADLITQNLDINGSSLDMKIEGRTGITERDYDQTIIVTPHVGSNVALATAFLGGPLTAATVFLLSQVTQLDNWVDKIITLEYTLKGSWDKPEIEFVSAPVAQKLDPTNTIKTPGKHIKSIIDKIFPGKKQ